PELPIAEHDFRSFLSARQHEILRDGEELAELAAADLYLICGCVLRQPAATRRLQERLLPTATAAVRRVCGDEASTHEVLQQVWIRLLVGASDETPRIAKFPGRGS